MTGKLYQYLLPFFVLACGATSQQQKESVVHMEPVIITGNSARPETEFYTAKEMFDRGRLAKAFDKYEDCVRFFSVVISDFMNTRYGAPAIYNRGLCRERLQDFDGASVDYAQFVEIATDPIDRLDGQFRLLASLVSGRRDTRALIIAEDLLTLDLPELDRAEVMVKKATILKRLTLTDSALSLLRAASRMAKTAGVIIRDNSVYAEAENVLGQIYLSKMSQIKLVLPLEKMKFQLAEKLDAFRKSQLHFLNSISTHVKGISTNSGELLGRLYAGLYGDLLNAEAPSKLNKLERDVYLEALISKITPVLRNAIKVYEKSISLGHKLGERKAWFERLRLEKSRLESILKGAPSKAGEPTK